MLRELAHVFIIMAFDKLKARAEDLTVTAQCEAMVPKFEGAIISTLHLKEDMSSILLNQFHLRNFMIMLIVCENGLP